MNTAIRPASQSPGTLIDPHGRRIRKLRLSLLDACNASCLYCMPETRLFESLKRCLQLDEIIAIVSRLIASGIEEIRVTGGEPTLHPEFISYMRALSQIVPGKLSFTTNGFKLEPLIEPLLATKCRHINVSLDSLQGPVFARITGRNYLDQVLKGIASALEAGFEIKVNCVLIRDQNTDEILDFIEFAARHKIEVRFLELMNIGVVGPDFEKQFFSADDCLGRIQRRYQIHSIPAALDSTAQRYQASNGARFGLIASETLPFCGQCSRWRLLANGELRACLFADTGISLRKKSDQEFEQILAATLPQKPMGRIERQKKDMYQIGG